LRRTFFIVSFIFPFSKATKLTSSKVDTQG
jgi:hypothetical protein